MICPCRQGIVNTRILLNVSSSVEQISLTNLNIRAASRTLLVKGWLESSCKPPGQSNSMFLLFNSHVIFWQLCVSHISKVPELGSLIGAIIYLSFGRVSGESDSLLPVFHAKYPGHASPSPLPIHPYPLSHPDQHPFCLFLEHKIVI